MVDSENVCHVVRHQIFGPTRIRVRVLIDWKILCLLNDHTESNLNCQCLRIYSVNARQVSKRTGHFIKITRVPEIEMHIIIDQASKVIASEC